MIKFFFFASILALISCDKNDLPENIEDGLLLDQSIVIDGIERDYHLFLPNQTENKPLVMLLHGNGGDFNQVIGNSSSKSPQKVWLSIAEENDFLLVIPNGSIGSSNRRGWNDCRNDAQGQSSSNDVLFLDSLLSDILNSYNYDNNKVYIAGVSNGGFMANRLAQEIPEKVTAIAAIVASIPINTECGNSNIPISALFMNGTDDPIVPYDGGQMAANRGLVLSTDESIDYWNDRNGITEIPMIEILPNINNNDGCTAEKISYRNGTNDTEVVLYRINDGGHTEPSIEERYNSVFLNLVGNQNGDLEMATEIWSFFRNKLR